jgi:hypothetical protein
LPSKIMIFARRAPCLRIHSGPWGGVVLLMCNTPPAPLEPPPSFSPSTNNSSSCWCC